jgi:protein TonB
MNILGNNSSKLNDVIFENRNKAYGAYAIREAYSDSLKKSILCLSGLVILLFGSVFAYNKINAIPTNENGIVIDDSGIKPLIYETIVEMKPLETPVQAAAAATAPTGGMPLRIVDAEPTNTTTINMNNPVSGVGTETATGTAAVGPETSTVTTIAVVAATTATTEAVVFAEEMPEFEGGNTGLMNYVARNVVYPELAKEAGKQGIVYVSFIVNETGKVEGAKVLKGIGLGCDEEVLRVINKMPQWKKAGKNGGHPVKVRFNIPVSFKLK